ncbi:helix-turn-helix domain-containing protein [Sphingobacterium sp. 18053]|uniref:helix-turn-helix domain-containing protein n=1 Tax=Sphingobacterium sp. 18053 TaxID=2681401 RepID=UPI00135C68B0|nr:helix-turn-helix domain-containing protein [Sphingobacterium sp. 18053]
MKQKSIPTNTLPANFGELIFISRKTFKGFKTIEEFEHSHRDDWHLFLLQEQGTTSIEIDFQKHKIKSLSVVHIHPNQVHRLIAFENATICSMAINNANITPEYLKLLEDITPAKPLSLKKETFSIIKETASLSIKLSKRKHEKLYPSLLKDSCNTLIALVTSQYLDKEKSHDTFSRFEIVTKSFKAMLESNFTTIKRPTDYAKKLNLSTPYLNECVRNTTGFSVSHHIQQRIILEAKRLLYHSDKAVKEIAFELGYDDYSYFVRLFTKIAGVTPLTFRNKNLV